MSDDNPTWGCCPRSADTPMPPNRACTLTYTIRRGLTRYIQRFEGKFVPADWAEVAWYNEKDDEKDDVPDHTAWLEGRSKKRPPDVNFCLVKGKDGRTFCVKFIVNGRGVKVLCAYSLFPVF